MPWQFFVGRFLQLAAGAGAFLTVLDWIRFGGAHVRVGHILLWSAVFGLAATSLAARRWRG